MTDPGWYGEPGNPTMERYWDGAQWTPETRPAALEQVEVQGAAPPALQAANGRQKVLAWVTVAVIVVAGAGFAVWWFALRTTTMTVHGTLDLEGGRSSGKYAVSAPDAAGNTSCEGVGGYSDIGPGATVTVTDGSGKTVGTGALEDGIWISGTGACIFGWQVTVPDDESSYGVAVSHRGTLQFSQSDMKSGPDLTLGGN